MGWSGRPPAPPAPPPDSERDRILRWVFRRVFGHRPRGDELADYAHAIDERDRLGLTNALPIFNELRQLHGAAAPLPVNPAAPGLAVM